MSNITKIAVAQSLKRMLLIKDLDKITISDITNDCGINRQTFYYHFKDIYDLLEWIFANEVVKKIEKEYSEEEALEINYLIENKLLALASEIRLKKNKESFKEISSALEGAKEKLDGRGK